jgi:acyl carrier protein
MAAILTIEALSAIAEEIIGLPSIALSSQMLASEIPGWDSLNHTLIILEISNMLGIELSAEETAHLPDLGALVALANSRVRSRQA